MDWSKVQKEHVEAAIQKFIEEKPEHPEPRSYYLMYNGEKLPSKYIRGLAYSIATGEELNLKGFNGGVNTVDFFAKRGYTVEQVSSDEDDKYSVNQAVWIATAMLAFEKYNSDPNVTREDMYFKQADIVNRAQLLVKSKVDSARVSWWVNADNEKATQNYLRADQLGNSTTRRLSMIDEFPDKTYPVELDGKDKLEINGQTLTIDELLNFVRNVYPEVMKKMRSYYENVIDNAEQGSGRAWLLTWNPDNWDWKDYKEQCVVTKQSETCIIPWTCSSKQPVEGDEVFLIKTGNQPRGIIAHGIVAKAAYKAPHYDPEKAAQGVMTGHIDAEYDWIQDYETEKLLMQDDLKKQFADQQWSPMGSGIEIKAEVLPELRKMWKELVGAYDGYWPSYEEYPVDLTKEDWKKFIEEVEYPSHKGYMRVLKCFLDIGGVASPKTLSEKYKGHPVVYTGSVYNTSRRALEYFKMEPYKDGEVQRFFPIAFLGQVGKDANSGTYVYKMRKELWEALQEIDMSEIELQYKKGGEDGMNDAEFDKNMILYGPPGTGKTYNTVIYAVAICTGKSIEAVSSEPYSEVLDEYSKLKKQGRIAFTTFHQSYGYEEFIEGIKPVLDGGSEIEYTIEDGVFKAFCNSAVRVKNQAIAKYASVWGVRYNTSKNWKEEAEIKKECFEKGIIEFDWNKLESDVQERFVNDIKIGDYVAIHLKGNHIDAIGKIVGDAKFNDDKDKYKWSRQVEWLITGADIDIQYANNGKAFHNFELACLSSTKPIELLKLIPGNENIDQESKLPYVFIIDEINRGNISKIFGELITLIEDTKRAGAAEAASTTLPYSGDSFSVPSNVYILGTMNTADRSIALMDTALRRRFSFEEKMPNSDILRNLSADMVEDLDVAKMLDIINERITYLYDREHTIGHAFFTGLADDPSVEKLAGIFEKSVIPLLQEYFYDDYQKIQLVLGDNGKTDDSYKFIKDVPVVVKNVFKGNLEDDIDIPEKKYELNKAALKKIQSYKEIM